MIRVIGFYRWVEGANFNHKYYNAEHMRLTQEVLAPHGLLRLESDHYISTRPPLAGEIIAASNAYFPSIEIAQAAMATVGAALIADVPNYTNLKPEVRLCVVTTHSSQVL